MTLAGLAAVLSCKIACQVIGLGMAGWAWTACHSMMSSSGVPSPLRSTNLPRIIGVLLLLTQSAQSVAMAGSLGLVDKSPLVQAMSLAPNVIRPLVLTKSWLLPV